MPEDHREDVDASDTTNESPADTPSDAVRPEEHEQHEEPERTDQPDESAAQGSTPPPTGGADDPHVDREAGVRYDPASAAPEPIEGTVRPAPEDVDVTTPLLVLLVPMLILGIGSWLWPKVFYDPFVYKYYWEPIVTDAGFNLVNTASWAVLMAILIFVLARTVQKISQPVTFALILATAPYMMAGSATRVLEDTGYFAAPLRYFFITPIIYVVIAAVAVLWILVGHMLKQRSRDVGVKGSLHAYGAFLAVVVVAYVFWGNYTDKIADPGSPWILLLAFAVPYAYFYNWCVQKNEFSQVGAMATFGVGYLLFAASFVVQWMTGPQWETLVPFADKPGPHGRDFGADVRPWILLLMLAAPAVFTYATWAIARTKAAVSTNALVYTLPINLLVVFGQMMDATMTALGVDRYGYSEKHVLPGFLIEGLDGLGLPVLSDYPATFVMLTAKLGVSLLVIWAIDLYAREDVKEYPDLVGLAKMAIIMVGLAPGTRNAVRLAMDV